ncbi:hypothetical protein ACFT6Z_36085, partial [Streptomyces sp. NPDC057131]|uniref:hypothetical protein n=1 Tax=Streptomyces sp. NPDC057131 TaxID=3346027 RepID=UPI003644FBC2
MLIGLVFPIIIVCWDRKKHGKEVDLHMYPREPNNINQLLLDLNFLQDLQKEKQFYRVMTIQERVVSRMPSTIISISLFFSF